MIYIPLSPATGGPMLAAYLAAAPDRAAIYGQLRARLDPAGAVGRSARYWISQRPERRAVLRGILLCLNEKLPIWSKEHRLGVEKRASFATGYIETLTSLQMLARTVTDGVGRG